MALASGGRLRRAHGWERRVTNPPRLDGSELSENSKHSECSEGGRKNKKGEPGLSFL